MAALIEWLTHHLRLVLLMVICLPTYFLIFYAFYGDSTNFLNALFGDWAPPIKGRDLAESRWAGYMFIWFIIACFIVTCGINELLAKWF